MKSAVESLNPTRVRLTVEVPFDELKPSVDQAYKRIANQVSIPGFRKGKVPSRLIDQRFGRGVVLEEAVNDALPKFYSQAVQEHSVQVLGQPEVDVTQVPDPAAGGDLKFSAEVDIRPEFELPEYDGLEVTVDDATVSDAEIDEQVQNLRERFGVLQGVERPAQDGDFVSIDLAATVDGEALDEASAKGLSHQVGSGALLDGLDPAIVGLSGGETATFSTTLVGGEYAGREAEITATVNSVKERNLPELDDDFAQTASEFDTLDELRSDLHTRLERMKKMQQGVDARDKSLEALLAKVDLPLPEGIIKAEVEHRTHDLEHQLESAGLTKADYLESEGKSEDEFNAEVEERARDAMKSQFVLDAIATKEQLSVSEQELSQHLVRRAMRVGMNPDEFAQQLVQSGQVSLLVGEVVRGKALARVLDQAKVTDTSGRVVDLEELQDVAPDSVVPDLASAEDGDELTDEMDEETGDTPDDDTPTAQSAAPERA